MVLSNNVNLQAYLNKIIEIYVKSLEYSLNYLECRLRN